MGTLCPVIRSWWLHPDSLGFWSFLCTQKTDHRWMPTAFWFPQILIPWLDVMSAQTGVVKTGATTCTQQGQMDFQSYLYCRFIHSTQKAWSFGLGGLQPEYLFCLWFRTTGGNACQNKIREFCEWAISVFLSCYIIWSSPLSKLDNNSQFQYLLSI